MKTFNKADLTPEQDDTITRLVEHDETLLMAGVGFGKAIVGMTALQELMALEPGITHCAVFAPLQVCDLTWALEPARWAHIETPVHICTGAKAKREKVALEWAGSGGIIVVNFENIAWFTETFTADAVLFDEISKLKTVGGTQARKLRRWVTRTKWRAGMSGSSVAEAGEDIYGQALLVDLGKALGTRKDVFLRSFFEQDGYGEHAPWVPKPGAYDAIAAHLGSLVYIPDQASYQASLPPVDDELLVMPFEPRVRAVYEALERDGVWGDTVVAENAAQQKAKLQQVAGGGLYGRNDKDEQILAWTNTLRHRWLADFIGECPEPLVVVYQFLFQLDPLLEAHPEAMVLGGGNKVTAAGMAAWDRGDIPLLFLHPASAAHGLNLQYGSRTLLHLSPIWGADPWNQCLGRVRRRGQKADTVKRLTVITEGTVDEEILERMDLKHAREEEMTSALVAATNARV